MSRLKERYAEVLVILEMSAILLFFLIPLVLKVVDNSVKKHFILNSLEVVEAFKRSYKDKSYVGNNYCITIEDLVKENYLNSTYKKI